MLYLYTGTDREKVRAKMGDATLKIKDADTIRITDAHTVEDLRAALQGGGMFAKKRVLVFEGVCTNPELSEMFLDSLEVLAESEESVFVFEEKPLADLRKKLEKHAEKTERFDAPKKEADKTIFALANALHKRDRKALWVGYMKELAKDTAPEAIHGILFWAAKSALLPAKADSPEQLRGVLLVSSLAALPHEARRNGFELEYALERFVLSLS